MTGNGGFFYKLRTGFRRFMEGRYGNDKLNMVLLWIGVGCSLMSMFIPFQYVKIAFWILSYIFMILAILRACSRKVYKRYQENRRFLRLVEQCRDRQHKYYSCPRCRQSVRVPRGKGKIAITCPKCKEKFIKKT